MSKQAFFLKLSVIITICMFLAIGMTSCVPAQSNNDFEVADNNQYTPENPTPTYYLPTVSNFPQALPEAELWVDAIHGDDGNDGQTPATAFRTIHQAANMAGPDTTVHILPGVYRESVRPANTGTESGHIVYLAEDGPDTVFIRGSEPTAPLTWTRLAVDTIGLPLGVDPANIYYADLSALGLEGPPRFIVELDDSGEVVSRMPLAREPDWQVVNAWKHHEFWWSADGGSDVAGCYPPHRFRPPEL